MSNKTIFQEKNTRLNNNNTDLASILETINNLPSAGGGGTNIQNISVKSPFETFSYYLAGYSYFDETTGTIQYFNDMNIENYYKQENFDKVIKVLPNSIFILTSIGTGTGYGMGNVTITGADDSECLFVSGNYAFIKIGTSDTTLEWTLDYGA